MLTLALVFSLFTAMPLTAGAADASALAATINDFNNGGTGVLHASASGNTVNVTGTVTGATNMFSLDIDSGLTVVWMASYSGEPPPITGETPPITVETPPVTSGIVAPMISGGGYHSLALKNDGTVWAWGYNQSGQLGDGSDTDRSSPVKVTEANGGEFNLLAILPPADTPGIGNFVKHNEYVRGLFIDVDESAWYGFDMQKVVATAYEYGLMRGNSDTATTFGPADSFTIAQAVAVAARIHSIYNTGEEYFVEGDPWYRVYIDYAIAEGIVAEGDFTDYNRAATRAETAFILSRSLPADALNKRNDVNTLPDVDDGTPYRDSILMLYEAGIIEGDTSGAYRPGDNITRAEVAAIISRIIIPDNRFEGKTY